MTKQATDPTPTEEKPTTLSTRQVVESLSEQLRRTVDPKTFRAFLREVNRGCGSGSRYAFSEDELPKLFAEFQEWNKAKDEKAAAKEEATKKDSEESPVEEEKPKAKRTKAVA